MFLEMEKCQVNKNWAYSYNQTFLQMTLLDKSNKKSFDNKTELVFIS